MDTNTVVELRQYVQAKQGDVYTTSQQVAEAFGKRHYHVLAKVRELDCSDHFLTHNFSWVQFEHLGNFYDAVEMTKDGFMFLVMGFTGKKAAAVKEGYIAAFNWMAEELRIDAKALIDSVIDSAQLGILKGLLTDKAKAIPEEKRISFLHTMHHRLHRRFSVPKTELIPHAEFANACNFVAAYALEGEWIGKDSADKGLAIHYPVSELAKRRPGMLTDGPGGRGWLDVSLEDLREIKGQPTPCEAILGELHKQGFEIEGAWWELRTYRNKLSALESWVCGMTREIKDPQRYAVSVGVTA